MASGHVMNSRAVEEKTGNPSLACVVCGRRSYFEAVPIPDSAFTRVIGHLKILSQFETIRGASVFA